jgi:ssDNA-binding Zn-finger/Zn-ribbon topoisomerase 1
VTCPVCKYTYNSAQEESKENKPFIPIFGMHSPMLTVQTLYACPHCGQVKLEIEKE